MKPDLLEVEKIQSFPSLYDLEITPLVEDPNVAVNSFRWIRQNPGVKVLTTEDESGEIHHYTYKPKDGPPRYTPITSVPYKLPEHISLMSDSKMEREVIAKASIKKVQGSWMEFGNISSEAHNAATSTNENIAIIHDLATDGKELFMITEYLPNGTLDSWLKSNHSIRDISRVVNGIANGLAHINAQQKLVYADMKPLNVGFDMEWQPKIIDFKLAAKIDSVGLASGDGKRSEYFAAPEQFSQNQILSVRTDIYSLAASVFSILVDGSVSEMSIKDIRDSFIDNPDSTIPFREVYAKLLPEKQRASLSLVLHKALQENPADRYSSVKEFNRSFQSCLNS